MIELQPSFRPRKITHALFDFDGTISLLRSGWCEVMHAMFVQCVPEVDPMELMMDISDLTGKQTIFQMIKLAERVKEQGRDPEPPLEYKKEFLRRLDHIVKQRKQAIADGNKIPENFRVYGSLEMLEDLRARGIHLVLASGTDEEAVREEADLLNVLRFFQCVFGARGGDTACVKRKAIEWIGDTDFAVFGDGFVEISEGKKAGALTVGVPSVEDADVTHLGVVDDWKYDRLLNAGADIIIPDFGDHQQLISTILNE